ncbi:MAG TPA: hypothetical protein VJR04_00335 [Terriglobales bacterium]|nr:hypothetical protein [Terriglobales bacterium]
MRSDLVHRANDKVQNRFQLCRLTSSSARRMARSSVGMHITINEALEAISGHSAPIVVQPAQADEVKAAETSSAFILDAAI